MRFATVDHMLYGLGVDASADAPVLLDDPVAVDWPTVHSGYEFVPMPPAVHGVWARCRQKPVPFTDLLEALAEWTDDPAKHARFFTDEHPAFVRWPWIDNGSRLLGAAELCLANTDEVPNPDPAVIPEAVWRGFPSIADLEACYQRLAGYDARWRLVESIPDWLAGSTGLHLQLLPPWKFRMIFAGVDPETFEEVDRITLLRKYAVDPAMAGMSGDGLR